MPPCVMARRLILYDATLMRVSMPPHFAFEATALLLRYLYTYDEPEGTNVLELTLGGEIDAESQACYAAEESLAGSDEMTKSYGDDLEFEGHETRDWGDWVPERGLEKHFEKMEN